MKGDNITNNKTQCRITGTNIVNDLDDDDEWRMAKIIKVTTALSEGAVMEIAKDNGDSICNNRRNNGD